MHVHLWPDATPAVEAQLVFRDRLRSSVEDRNLYAAAKSQLAQQAWPTMNHYAAAKSDVIRQILARAAF